ncbi:hypothetical protein EE612_023944, partial [Oryza sativa]
IGRPEAVYSMKLMVEVLGL